MHSLITDYILNDDDHGFLLFLAPFNLPACGQHMNVQLLPKSSFPVGYGNSNTMPLSFDLSEGIETDISFFKLFVTNKPTDFSFLAQWSPLHPTSRYAECFSNTQAMQPDVWETVTI